MVFLSGGAPEPMTFKPEGPAKLYVIINKMVIPPKIWYEQGIALASYKYQRQYPNVKLLNYIGSINAHQTVIPKYGAQEALFISPNDNLLKGLLVPIPNLVVPTSFLKKNDSVSPIASLGSVFSILSVKIDFVTYFGGLPLIS